MLQLDSITKTYPSGDVTALRGVSLAFRPSEFVSVLGPSGCGKTTLLNIIGGLDRYSSGELYVRHVPTARFGDRDWDAYRNHSIGFVFQSYNLIPHQSVLANVELALTLSGVSKSERRRRAKEALEAVGLGDQLKKKPSQMSGGQMQRVAIARALVNDPDILLADEPTGALDSETSVQVMEILKKVAEKKLIIMVTHNPDLAERYSTRIIRLLDGEVLSDSDPYSPEEEAAETYRAEAEDDDGQPDDRQSNDDHVRGKKKRTSMSFFTALSLSLNNLMTKKARTFLTAFGGSIGIIGIALILSLSNGINRYIAKVQEDTLSAYPIQINAETVDLTSVMTAMISARDGADGDDWEDDGIIRSNPVTLELMQTVSTIDVQENNLGAFMDFIAERGGDFDGYASAVSYGYDIPLHLYSVSETGEDGLPRQINPSSLFSGMRGGSSGFSGSSGSSGGGPMGFYSVNVWEEMIDNPDLMAEQYDLVAGEWPDAWDELVLVVDEQNRINDLYLYSLGIKPKAEFDEIMKSVFAGEEIEVPDDSWSPDELIGHEFALMLPADLYQKDADGVWQYMGENESFMKLALGQSERLRIVGIIRPDPEAVATSLNGAVGYLPALSRHVMDRTEASEIYIEQAADPDTDLLSGLPYPTDEFNNDSISDEERAAAIRENLSSMTPPEKAAAYTLSATSLSDEDAAAMAADQLAAMPPEGVRALLSQAMTEESGMDADTVGAYLAGMTDEEAHAMAMQVVTEQVKQNYAAELEETLGAMTNDELAAALDQNLTVMTDADVVRLFHDYMPPVVSDRTYEDVMAEIGAVDRAHPDSIRIYSETFSGKDEIARLIREYNADAVEDGREEDVIHYTDYVALMMSSISTIIDVISYVLIAFVSISLVVSSIMIGIITYISVLERTKEIGILRAVGASKRDISRVFNAETLIVGFASGALGILVTLLLCIPANVIIRHLTDIGGLARLPASGGAALVVISMLLTMTAGLIPSHLAAKKDPVEALRNE
ncbi:MAG: ABC transporter ATP-binding protein/permease [Clostridia bacterium]|nr:ABC transporter ATP-binding protein/permease [Clostridia bacterium]